MNTRHRSVIASARAGRAPRPLAVAFVLAIGSSVMGAGPAPSPGDEQVEQYLARLGVSSVLAERLEHELTLATGEQRTAIAEHLAEVYAGLLSSVGADARAAHWENRASELLKSVPEAGSIELRLALARAAFVRAEASAERGVLRMAPPEESLQAIHRLDALIGELDHIADDANRRVIGLEKREESGSDRDATLLNAALSDGRRTRSIAHFLAGNAAIQVALANHSAEHAEIALKHLGWILGARPDARPEIERLAEQNLMYPHVAKAALAVALAHAIRDRPDEAVAWLQAVRAAERLPADIPDLITTRQIQCLAASGQWSELADFVRTLRAPARDATGGEGDGGPRALSPMHARLVAVLALGAPDMASKSAVGELRDAALADLVAMGELGHVLDIASVFGTAGFSSDSYIGLEVRGLKAYDDARRAHSATDPDFSDPPSDAATRKLYATAAELLEHALRAPGADAYPDAGSQTMLLVGVCQLNAQDMGAKGADPTQRLIDASKSLRDPVRAATALRLAIHALDGRIGEGEGDVAALAAQRDALIDGYLERFPDDAFAPALIIRRAGAPGFDRMRGLTMLLSVPASSPWYAGARHHASVIAFELYRAAPPSERDWAARRYLDLEEPLLAADRREASKENRESADRATARARRIIEASLGLEVPDVTVAERALEVVDSLIALGLIDPEPLRGEMAYRRAQIALHRGDTALADALLAAAAAADPSLARAGDQLRFRAAVRSWRLEKAADPMSESTMTAAVRVADIGRALLTADADGASEEFDAFTGATCAEAMVDLFTARGDRAMGEQAAALLKHVLAGAPNARTELHRYATITESLGQFQESLEAWRTLLAGLEPGTGPWFEARVHHVRILARVDPARARTVLDQHVALYPGYGPDPWGPDLRAIHETLGASP